MEYILLIIALFVLLETSFLTYQQLRRNTKRTSTAIYVDTSVLIDGRIVDIAKTGFITAQLVIPRSVIGELQLLSDGADHDKRARARHGLDVARELRTMDTVDVHLLQDGSTAEEGVDERLLNLAKKHGGMICTIDYNLNKVAQVEGIRVLNINELAKSIRMEFLPGERQSLALIQKGQNAQQAVGYTADGTMVVVDGATKRIGTTVDVEIVRSIQTDSQAKGNDGPGSNSCTQGHAKTTPPNALITLYGEPRSYTGASTSLPATTGSSQGICKSTYYQSNQEGYYPHSQYPHALKPSPPAHQ